MHTTAYRNMPVLVGEINRAPRGSQTEQNNFLYTHGWYMKDRAAAANRFGEFLDISGDASGCTQAEPKDRKIFMRLTNHSSPDVHSRHYW